MAPMPVAMPPRAMIRVRNVSTTAVSPQSLLGRQDVLRDHHRQGASIHPSAWKVNSPKLGSLLLRVFGLFLFHYPQALDHLEAEAHYAALLALVLDVDGLVVVVDEYLGEDPLVVVEPFCPLGDIFVLHLSGLLAHTRVLLPSR